MLFRVFFSEMDLSVWIDCVDKRIRTAEVAGERELTEVCYPTVIQEGMHGVSRCFKDKFITTLGG